MPNEGEAAVVALSREITRATEFVAEARKKRTEAGHMIPTTAREEHARMLLVSEAMKASMDATEILAHSFQLAFNMIAFGLQATVTPAAERADFAPEIVSAAPEPTPA